MVAKVKARQIYEFVNSGELHFTEDRFGLLYICSESLRNLGTAETGGVARAANDSDETIFESDESDSHGDEIPRRHPNSQ